VRVSVPSASDTRAEPRTPANGGTPGGRPLQGFATSWLTSRPYWLAAAGILLFAIFLRLWRLDVIIFIDDQATLLRLAEDIDRLGRFPLAGMTSSIGIPSAPIFEYVLAPIVAVSRDPRVATAAIGLANVAAIGGTLALGWRWFSPLTGVVAGLVYATNPWAVFYARKIWSNDLLPPIAVLLMYCLDKAVVGGQAGWGLVAFPLFALGVELHPSFALLAPLLVVLAVVQVRRGQLKHVAIGLGLVALTAVPYVIFILQTQARYLASPGTSGTQTPRIDGDGPGDVMGLIGGWHNWTVEGLDTMLLLPQRLVAVPGAIETVFLALGILAALRLVFGSRQVEHRLRAAGLLLWVALPMLLTMWHPIPLYDYYYLFVLPAGALLIGLGFRLLGDLPVSRRIGRLLVGAALAATIVVASIQTAMVLRQLGYLTDGYVMKFGPPLQTVEQTTRELIDQMDTSGSRRLSVEIDDVNDVAIGYLARPYVPEVQVVARRRGPWDVDFGLPNASRSAPYAFTGPQQLTAPESLDVAYADGARILSGSTTKLVTPGESVGLALSWTVDHHSAEPLTTRLLWEVSLYDPSGHEVRRVAGMAHEWAQLPDGEVVTSWITASTTPDFADGVYLVHVNRLDPQSRKPIPAMDGAQEWTAGTVEFRGNELRSRHAVGLGPDRGD
jgi:hypothetical protein